MKGKKPAFNRYEKAILRVTAQYGRPMSIKEIAEKTNMSWVTSKKYAKLLKARNWLKTPRKSRFEFNYSRLGIKRRLK